MLPPLVKRHHQWRTTITRPATTTLNRLTLVYMTQRQIIILFPKTPQIHTIQIPYAILLTPAPRTQHRRMTHIHHHLPSLTYPAHLLIHLTIHLPIIPHTTTEIRHSRHHKPPRHSLHHIPRATQHSHHMHPQTLPQPLVNLQPCPTVMITSRHKHLHTTRRTTHLYHPIRIRSQRLCRRITNIKHITTHHHDIRLLPAHHLRQITQKLPPLVHPVIRMQRLTQMPITRMQQLYHISSFYIFLLFPFPPLN